MGTISSQIQSEDPENEGHSHTVQTELKIDFTKDVNPNLKQLLYWSLAEIRGVYEKFRQRSNIPFIDKSTFCHIVPFTRMNSKFIFQNLCQEKAFLNIFELLAILIITSYTHYVNKIHLLFLIFDFDCSDSIQLEELIVIFICSVQGFCKLTEIPIPSYSNLEKYAKLMFLKSDIQADNELSLPEIIEWVEGNIKAMEIFARFEPSMKIRENIDLFKHFKKYPPEDGLLLIKIIKKASKSQFFYNNLDILLKQVKSIDRMPIKEVAELPLNNLIVSKDSPVLKTKTQILPRILEKYGIPRRKDVIQQTIVNKKNIYEKKQEEDLIEKALLIHTKHHTYQKDYKLEEESNSEISKHEATNFFDSSSSKLPSIKKLVFKGKYKRGASEKNLIIIKGETITKNEVYKLKDYFDKLSDKGKSISIKEFTKAFSEKSHMKSVIPSLFNFLDKKAKGFVTFEELTLRIYPTLTKKNLAVINKWVKSYSKALQRDQKTGILKEEKEDENVGRKKILPHSTIKRFQELFELYDEEHKGYITLQNLKSNSNLAFNSKELEDMFNEFDEDKDGKWFLGDFIKFLLPADYMIDEKEDIIPKN